MDTKKTTQSRRISKKAPERKEVASWWNHRIVKKNGYFAIHEVHYEAGKPVLVTQDPTSPFGESLEELKRDMKHFQDALKHPALNYEDF